MKLDRRLAGRRGWIEEAELARELSALPDVADKAAEPTPAAAPSGEPPENP